MSGIVVWKLLLLLVALGVAVYLGLERLEVRAMRGQQDECRLQLAELGRRMIDYRQAHGAYTTDLSRVGWAPSGTPRYAMGFTVPYDVPGTRFVPDYLSFSGFVQVDGKDLRGSWNHTRQVRGDGLYLNRFDLMIADGGETAIPQANETCFLAGAAADLDGDPALDRWTIDCNLDLVHVYDDVIDEFVGWPHLDPFTQSLDRSSEGR